MKKVFLMLAAGMMAASVNAQNTAITSNKAGDNWYLGINAGVATPTLGHAWVSDVAPNVGVRLGKNLTTVFGLAAEGNAYYYQNGACYDNRKTVIDALNVNLLGTFNLSNLLAGYKGEPRCFEVIALGGFGWGHAFGTGEDHKANGITSKVAVDFALNLGAAKALQLYLEPSLNYGMQGYENAANMGSKFKYNLAKSNFQLNLGVNYKFGNSNGTHNFAVAQLRDQAEIDGLNAKINELRADNNAKDGKIAASARTIAELQKKLAACEARPTTAAVVEKTENVLQPHVIFRQGKSTIEPAQYASIEMVAKYMKNHKDAKVKVQGYASPEGSKELNQKLSEARANAVKTALVKKYKIAADRITVEGLGATDKLSAENDFNRVAMFVDVTK